MDHRQGKIKDGSPIQDVLAALQGVTRGSDSHSWYALCPAHEDRQPSLTVGIGAEGRVLLCCQKGCPTKAIVEALRMTWSDLFVQSEQKAKSKRIVACYDYRDEAGVLRHQTVRFEPKSFSQRRPNGQGWAWSLKGVQCVLYRLPELLAAALEEPVWIPEGEKDVEALRRLGLIATTNAMGAKKWRTSYNEALRDRPVVLLPDNDDDGRQHAEQLKKNLDGIAASVTFLELPDLPKKGDVSDWLASGGTKEQLLELAAKAREPRTWSSGRAPSSSIAPRPPTSPPTNETPKDPEPPAEIHLTDLGNAQRVVARHGQELRFCHAWKQFLIWDEQRWATDDTGAAVRMTKETQRSLYRWAADGLAALAHDSSENEEAKKGQATQLTRVLQHALKWEDARRISACLELVRSEASIPIRPANLDRDPWLLNVANGTISLRTGQLHAHQRADLLTKLAPVAFDPDATCPLWERCLDKWMGGKRALVEYLRRIIGYALSADVSEQVLFFLHGAGSNGKSTFLSTIRELLGDYACQAVSELLTAKNTEAHPTERADLFGRRFVATIETDEGKRMAEALMKQLTGGDNVKARKMRQDFFDMPPTWKIFLAANHKPVIRGTDFAVWRRIRLIPFTVTISEADKDKHLVEKLRGERAGILNWALAGCREWQSIGMADPEEVRQATEAYQREQDSLANFFGECCVIHPEARIKSSLLLAKFQEWSGDKNITQQAFRIRLNDKGFQSQKGTGNVYFYHGIGLPAEAEEDDQSGGKWR